MNVLEKNLSRRGFLIGTGSTAALTMGYTILPFGITAAEAATADMFSPSHFFDLHENGRVTLHLPQAEMGQHVGTSLGQILCEELECGFDSIDISYVGIDARFGLMITGGSWSVNWHFDKLARAGAAGRIALIEAAAAKLGGSPADYTALDGVISGNGASISYAELVKAGVPAREFSEEELAAIELRPAAERRFIGKSVPAIDIPDKVRGKAKFGIDVALENMVYATPATPPVRFGASVKSVDESEALKIPGYMRHVVIEDPLSSQTGWVMAIADSYWTAKKAAEALKVDWDLGPNANVSLDDIYAESERLIETGEAARTLWLYGDVEAAMAGADAVHEAMYQTGMNLHMPLEPLNATVEVLDGIYHIYAGHQFQTLISIKLPEALGVTPEQVVLHQQIMGGGFGRRLEVDNLVMAALTAKALDRPVKMIYSREADTEFMFARAAGKFKMTASTKDGRIDGWKVSAASAWVYPRQAPGFLAKDVEDPEKELDAYSINGANHWYTIPNQKVQLSMNELAQSASPAGSLRDVSSGPSIWATECFMDEVAHAIGADPLEMRLSMLDGTAQNAGDGITQGGAKRLAHVLKTVADKAGYGSNLGENTAVGLCVSTSHTRGTAVFIAGAAQVTVNKETGDFTVDKLYAAIDVGQAVNPDGIMAQVTGGLMWGLSGAILEEVGFQNGRIQASNFDTYTPARISDVPEIDVIVVESGNYPVGCGEPGLSVVAPAIANAIQMVTGARVRSLPITPAKVKAAMDA